MLNKHKVLQELQAVVPQLFFATGQEREIAYKVWRWLLDHPEQAEPLKCSVSPWQVPLWLEQLGTAEPIKTGNHGYSVTAVDGSQIYPDRHQGIGCYLLNIGTVTLTYDGHLSGMKTDSTPSVYALQENESLNDLSPERINCQRSELELQVGLKVSTELTQKRSLPHLFLCDGSLIFWHLDSQDDVTKERFLQNSLALLDDFYEKRLLIAGFISLPKSKELVNIVRTAIDKNVISFENKPTFEYIVDSDVILPFLPTYTRSALFAHCSSIIQRYPEHLRPHFMYVNINQEIIRIEVPAWIAQDQEALLTTLEIALDQCIKGHGYPVALSEAHEQAVVKSVDREFFFHMLYKLSADHNYPLKPSQKSLKKKFVSI